MAIIAEIKLSKSIYKYIYFIKILTLRQQITKIIKGGNLPKQLNDTIK